MEHSGALSMLPCAERTISGYHSATEVLLDEILNEKTEVLLDEILNKKCSQQLRVCDLKWEILLCIYIHMVSWNIKLERDL